MMMRYPLRLRGKTRSTCLSYRVEISMGCTLLKRLCCRLDFLQVLQLDCCLKPDFVQIACFTSLTLLLSCNSIFHWLLLSFH